MSRNIARVLIAYAVMANLAGAQQADWRIAAGTSGKWFSELSIFDGGTDTLVALTANCIMRSTNRGDVWDSISWPGTTIGGIAVHPSNQQIIFINIDGFSPQASDTYRSTDGGITWGNPLFFGNLFSVKVVEFDPCDRGTVYVGAGPGRLYRSPDSGQVWDTLHTISGRLISLAIAKSNNTILYAGYVPGVAKSTDRGASWTPLNLGFVPPDGVFVAVDPRNEDVVYAGVWNSGAGPGGMYRSTDGGTSWNEINNGISVTQHWIQSLAINPKNPDEILLGLYGNQGVLLRTTNGGANWSDFSNGLNVPARVNTIRFDTVNNRMYAGLSNGLYIYQRVTGVNNEQSNHSAMELLQSYPNPFNPTTTIRYQLTSLAHVTLSVFDLLGREVATLVDDMEEPGEKRATFDGSALASGVYFYRLRAGDFVQTRKLVLVR